MLESALEELLRRIIREEIEALVFQTPEGNTHGQPKQTYKPYLAVKEAATLARLAPSTVRLYIRKGQLKARKVGRRVIVKREDLEGFLGAHPTVLAN